MRKTHSDDRYEYKKKWREKNNKKYYAIAVNEQFYNFVKNYSEEKKIKKCIIVQEALTDFFKNKNIKI